METRGLVKRRQEKEMPRETTFGSAQGLDIGEDLFMLRITVYDLLGSLLIPISTRSIQTWALEEARRRLEAEGILADPSPVATKSIPATITDSLPSIPGLTESSKDE